MNESRVPQFALGCIFRTYRNFWVSTDFSLVKDPKISIRHKTSTAIASIVCFCRHCEQIRRIYARFCESQNLEKKHCHSGRSEESLFLNLCEAPLNKVFASFGFCQKKNPPNLQDLNLPKKANSQNLNQNNFRRICTRFCVFLILQIPLFASTIDESFTPNKNHSINILSENDAYFEPLIRSDEYYTGGHFISYTSPEFEKSWINYIAGFSHLQDRHFTRFLISINQELYTPDKKYDYDFKAPVNDILFGAGLYANLSFISRTRDFMEQFSLDLGVVGPLAFGKQVQNGIHRITNNREVFGWDVGALKNEALINLHYGLIYRWVFIEDFFDVLPSFQISLGNALTAINAGVKFRVGYGIKNDFGAQKLHSRFAQNIVGDGLKIYGVFGVRGSIVGRDIFIEGNSFGGAKSGVTINRFLYEIEVGAMIGWKYVSFGYIWSDESKRFKEQSANHEYGSLRLEIMF